VTPLLQARINAHKTLTAELDALVNSESLDANALKRVNDLPSEIDAAEAAIKQAKELEDRSRTAKGFHGGGFQPLAVAGYENEDEIIPGMPRKMVQNSMRIEGKAGIEVIRNGKSVDGEGWFTDEKTFKAISEPTYVKAFDAVVIRGKGDRADYKALVAGIDADGGWLAPPEYIAELIARDPYPTSILSRVRTVPCSRDKVIWPRLQYDTNTADIYTSPVRMTFGSDQGNSGEIDPTFGDVEIPIWTGLFPIELNRNLLEDAAIPVSQIVQELAGEAYRLGLDYYSTVGTGVNQPWGIFQGAGGAFPGFPTQNVGNPVTANGLSDLTLLLPPQYREDKKNTALLTSTANFATFAKLQDTSGQYIYGLDRRNGPGGMEQERIERHMGYDVIFSAFTPAIGSGNSIAAFGDFRKAYILAQRVGLSVFPYGDQDKSMLGSNKVGWYFRCRAGGMPVQNRAVHVAVQS
jgi:HK97 family phage major capsid protein